MLRLSIFCPQFMDLRTHYTALVTLMTQYVKFASENLKRAEEDEVGFSYDCVFLIYVKLFTWKIFTIKIAIRSNIYI